VAVPVPELVTVTVKPIGSPAFTVWASATLVMWIDAPWQVMSASDELPPSLPLATVAVLSYVVHSAAEVVAVMWTVRLAPAARLIGWPTRLRVWLGLLPPMTKAAALAPPLIDQVTPAPEPAGSGSLRVTPVAVPALERAARWHQSRYQAPSTAGYVRRRTAIGKPRVRRRRCQRVGPPTARGWRNLNRSPQVSVHEATGCLSAA
jgi:hypothetical protein